MELPDFEKISNSLLGISGSAWVKIKALGILITFATESESGTAWRVEGIDQYTYL